MPEDMTAPMGDGFDQRARDAVYRAMFTRRDVRSHFLPNALDTVFLLRITRGDRRRVEQAEAHGRSLFGMVAGRPGGDEDIVGAA